jgi:hypothetical protein
MYVCLVCLVRMNGCMDVNFKKLKRCKCDFLYDIRRLRNVGYVGFVHYVGFVRYVGYVGYVAFNFRCLRLPDSVGTLGLSAYACRGGGQRV